MHRRNQLRALLQSYQPQDTRERAYLDRMLSLLDSSGDPLSRDHYLPGHFTASSFVLSPDGQRLLLIYHSKLERWLQPGGHIDPTDVDVIAAARREAKEEVGLSELTPAAPRTANSGAPGLGDAAPSAPQLFDIDIHVIPARANAPKHEHFDLRFLWQAPSLKAQAGSDALECQWVPLDQIAQLESDESVMRAVKKL